MFCPKCGAADQSPETYCRQCGLFLPDLEKLKKKEVPAEQHIAANSFLSLATAIVSLLLAIVLYSTVTRPHDTPWIIYLVAGFLIAITAWQIQVFIRTKMLKKQLENMKPHKANDADDRSALETQQSAPMLEEADFESAVPVSVTERTTRNLAVRSSQPKH